MYGNVRFCRDFVGGVAWLVVVLVFACSEVKPREVKPSLGHLLIGLDDFQFVSLM